MILGGLTALPQSVLTEADCKLKNGQWLTTVHSMDGVQIKADGIAEHVRRLRTTVVLHASCNNLNLPHEYHLLLRCSINCNPPHFQNLLLQCSDNNDLRQCLRSPLCGLLIFCACVLFCVVSRSFVLMLSSVLSLGRLFLCCLVCGLLIFHRVSPHYELQVSLC